MLSAALDFLKSIIAWVIDLLPDSPFQFDVPPFIQELLGYINYFIPIGFMVKILLAWTACIAVWYVVQVAARWAKVIE